MMNQPTPGMLVTPTVRLLHRMSGGAMGSVWLAEHAGLATQVVVKFIAPEVCGSPEVVARFAREAAAASRVKSPHVVQMLDHGVTKVEGTELPYIIMELLEGKDLQKHVREKKKLPAAEVAIIIGQLSKALARAHERGVLHRDIKPSNVFLCDVGGAEIFVKLLDFGVAKSLNGTDLDTTKAGAILGTPYFMSPEQLQGGEIDHTSDLWALGVLAFMLLTGQRPFRGDSVANLTLAIHVHELPKLTTIDPALPPALDVWFAKACARDRAQRFTSARELAEALLAALDMRDAINVAATGAVPAVAPPAKAPGDAPSVPGLGSSAYNYSTHSDAPLAPPRKKRVAIFVGAAFSSLAIIVGIVVIRGKEETTPSAAPAAPKPHETTAASQTQSAPPTASASHVASTPTPPAKSVTKPAPAIKPKTPPKADDPFGESRL